MYPQNEAKEPTQSNHNAEKMGLQIVAEFPPDQQNQMVTIIKHVVTENRQMEIEKIKKHLKYLEDTLVNI